MKYILIFLLVIGMLFSTGCFVAPVEPEPVVTIVCECGYYTTYSVSWSFTGCEDDPWYPAGVYWNNANGRVFLLGDPVWGDEFSEIYGVCPTEFIEEIFK